MQLVSRHVIERLSQISCHFSERPQITFGGAVAIHPDLLVTVGRFVTVTASIASLFSSLYGAASDETCCRTGSLTNTPINPPCVGAQPHAEAIEGKGVSLPSRPADSSSDKTPPPETAFTEDAALDEDVLTRSRCQHWPAGCRSAPG